MEQLTRLLKRSGYDLIESPIRNHKLTQLWLKRDFDKIIMYQDIIQHALKSTVELNEITNSSLNVNSTYKNEFNFNFGLTILDEILKSLNINNLNLGLSLKSGKKVTISYDDSTTKEIELGQLENYLSNFDFTHQNQNLKDHLNSNNVIVIIGVLIAKNISIEVETDFKITGEIKAKLEAESEGKLDFSLISENKLKMTGPTSNYYPIAVKAIRLDFDRGIYRGCNLVTDNRNFF